MGDTSETNTKVLSRELFLGVVALKTPIPQNHYLRDEVPFLKSGHIYVTRFGKIRINAATNYFCFFLLTGYTGPRGPRLPSLTEITQVFFELWIKTFMHNHSIIISRFRENAF